MDEDRTDFQERDHLRDEWGSLVQPEDPEFPRINGNDFALLIVSPELRAALLQDTPGLVSPSEVVLLNAIHEYLEWVEENDNE